MQQSRRQSAGDASAVVSTEDENDYNQHHQQQHRHSCYAAGSSDLNNLRMNFAHAALHDASYTPEDPAATDEPMYIDSEFDDDADADSDSGSSDLDMEINYLEFVVSQLSGAGTPGMPGPWQGPRPQVLDLYVSDSSFQGGGGGNMNTNTSLYTPSPSPYPGAANTHPATVVPFLDANGNLIYPAGNSMPFPTPRWTGMPMPLPANQLQPVPNHHIPIGLDAASELMSQCHIRELASAMESAMRLAPHPLQHSPPSINYPPLVVPSPSPVDDELVNLVGTVQDYMTGLEQSVNVPSS